MCESNETATKKRAINAGTTKTKHKQHNVVRKIIMNNDSTHTPNANGNQMSEESEKEIERELQITFATVDSSRCTSYFFRTK